MLDGHVSDPEGHCSVRRIRWPCGNFPVQAARDTGLSVWTEADRSVGNTDVVLWYVFGLPHITWLVMPADIVSCWLKPCGFSGRNPSHEVPPSHHH
jgi:primary-amine oxidase